MNQRTGDKHNNPFIRIFLNPTVNGNTSTDQ